VHHAVAAIDAFFATLRRVPVKKAQLAAEGGVGDPAATALLYGAAWALVGGLVTAKGEPVEIVLTPRLEGPAGGRLDARAEVSLTSFRLLLGVLRALRARR
jgi:hypothetical protein